MSVCVCIEHQFLFVRVLFYAGISSYYFHLTSNEKAPWFFTQFKPNSPFVLREEKKEEQKTTETF